MHARHELKAPTERETNVVTNRAQKIFCQQYDKDVSNPGGKRKEKKKRRGQEIVALFANVPSSSKACFLDNIVTQA
jgi:hypothetical protein